MVALSNSEYVNLDLQFNDEPEKICILGNTIGFFGAVIDNKISLSDTNPNTVNNNLCWLISEAQKKSEFMIIGDKDTYSYYKVIFRFIGNSIGRRVIWRNVNISKATKTLLDFREYESKINKSYLKVLEVLDKKNMKFTKIIMNPPYDVGGKITKFIIRRLLQDEKFCICLMPLAQYKANELYRYVVTFGLADPKMFIDATITDNLSICKLSNKIVNIYSWEKLERASYNENCKSFFNKNKGDYVRDLGQPCIGTKYLFDWNNTFVYILRASINGVHIEQNTADRIYNLSKSYVDIDDIQQPESGRYSLRVLKLKNRKSCDNLALWWYYNGKNGLADLLLHSLNKVSGSIIDAIPQIDWEKISEHPLWIKGAYDEAVLDTMGLKWSEDKTSILEK